MEQIAQHEHEIVRYGVERLGYVPGLKVYGTDMGKQRCCFFLYHGWRAPHDVAQVLDDMGIAVRAGHHCAMPLHQKYGLPATTRASFYLYNSPGDVDHLVQALLRVNQLFGKIRNV
jgi:cysteine desulfurase/selenocysteine lyase